MPAPRAIILGRTHMVTRRTSERRFFLRPSKKLNQAIEYCLARAIRRSGVIVHLVVVLSNHYHIIVSDPHGTLPVFTEELNKLIARCLNHLHGRFENFWAGGAQTSYVHLAQREDVLAKSCYAMLNPVVAGLVKSWRDWPGLLIVTPGKRRVKRPDFFFRKDSEGGTLPRWEEYEIHAPPIAERPGQSMRILHDMVRAFQKRAVAARLAKGLGFLGAARVRKQSIWDSPKTSAPRFGLSPKVAARDKWRRIELLCQIKSFNSEHELALRKWQSGDRGVIFPAGTYLMRVLHKVKCAVLGEPCPALAET
jgi:REP element-mobilizing transposase RayT